MDEQIGYCTENIICLRKEPKHTQKKNNTKFISLRMCVFVCVSLSVYEIKENYNLVLLLFVNIPIIESL